MTRKPTPNYDRFDFGKFVNSKMDMDYHEMLRAFDQECARVEASMRGRGGPQAQVDGGRAYVARLKRVLFWLQHFALADRGQEAPTCRKIAIKLVDKGQLKPEALMIFRHLKE